MQNVSTSTLIPPTPTPFASSLKLLYCGWSERVRFFVHNNMGAVQIPTHMFNNFSCFISRIELNWVPDHAQLLLFLFLSFVYLTCCCCLMVVLPLLLLLVAIFRVINFREGIKFLSCRKSQKAKTKKQHVNDDLLTVGGVKWNRSSAWIIQAVHITP